MSSGDKAFPFKENKKVWGGGGQQEILFRAGKLSQCIAVREEELALRLARKLLAIFRRAALLTARASKHEGNENPKFSGREKGTFTSFLARHCLSYGAYDIRFVTNGRFPRARGKDLSGEIVEGN